MPWENPTEHNTTSKIQWGIINTLGRANTGSLNQTINTGNTEHSVQPNYNTNEENKSILHDTKGARSKTNTMHSSYLPQEHNTTEQLNKPTSKPTTATQGQAGGRPTYFKRLSIDYKGKTIHFTHFGCSAPSTDQYERYNEAGKMLGRKESYQGGPQNMMPSKSLPPGQTQWEVNWIPTAPPNTWGGGKWQYPLAHQPFMPARPTLHQQEGD
jgi:hypothetical protein